MPRLLGLRLLFINALYIVNAFFKIWKKGYVIHTFLYVFLETIHDGVAPAHTVE